MLEDELLKWKFRRGNREALARIYEKYLDPKLTPTTEAERQRNGRAHDPAVSV